MAFWFVENWLDKKRNENELRKQQQIAQFQQDLDWKNRDRFLEELRKTGAASQVDPALIEGLARSTMFPLDPTKLAEVQKYIGTKDQLVPTARAANDANMTGNQVTTQFNQGALPVAKTAGFTGTMNKIAQGAANAGSAIANMERDQADADKAKALKEQTIAAELEALRAKQNEATVNAKKASGQAAGASEYGKNAMAAANAGAMADTAGNQNRLTYNQAFAAAEGPKATANFSIPPATIEVNGEQRPFNQHTAAIMTLQNVESDRAKAAATDLMQQGRNEEAIAIAKQMIEKFKGNPYLSNTWNSILVQSLRGRGLSMPPAPSTMTGLEAFNSGGGGTSQWNW